MNLVLPGIALERTAGSRSLGPAAQREPGAPVADGVRGAVWWRACRDLLHSVRTGQPPFDYVYGESLFPYLCHIADAAAIFN
jgi:hypothetical protein